MDILVRAHLRAAAHLHFERVSRHDAVDRLILAFVLLLLCLEPVFVLLALLLANLLHRLFRSQMKRVGCRSEIAERVCSHEFHNHVECVFLVDERILNPEMQRIVGCRKFLDEGIFCVEVQTFDCCWFVCWGSKEE